MIMEQRGIFEQAVDVKQARRRAGELKGGGGFLVAVGAGGSKNQHARLAHPVQ